MVAELLGGVGGLRVLADAADGVQVLSAIQRTQPRVAVLDVEMPGLTGLEVARAVRAAGLPTAIVLLTMHNDLFMVRAAMEIGVAAYVLKDDLDTDLMPAIYAAAEKKTYFQSRKSAIPSALATSAPSSAANSPS